MRVVVTGATGNVGTAVVDALCADDQVTEVVGVARRRPDRVHPEVRIVTADVGTDDLVPHLRGADALVHLAWMFQPTHRPEVTWQSNAVGSARLFDAAAEAGVGAVVHASSVGAYSPAPGRTVDESWPTHSLPGAGYGREKAYVERVLDAFEARHPGIRVVRLRPAFIFQEQAATAQRRIFAGPLLPNPLLARGRLPVLPWPRGLRFQALHASDVAQAYRLAVTHPGARGAFNVAANPVVDAEVVGELLGARPVPVPARAARAALAGLWHLHAVPAEPALLDLVLSLPLLDTSRIRDELGWEPTVSSVEALHELLQGMVRYSGGETPPLEEDSLRGRLHEVGTGMGERY
ncbi:MAG TPA: NAD-dependent epimerase/dehydratase family protein [Nocardioidaceae bacterium]